LAAAVRPGAGAPPALLACSFRAAGPLGRVVWPWPAAVPGFEVVEGVAPTPASVEPATAAGIDDVVAPASPPGAAVVVVESPEASTTGALAPC
jgi:hypothetical protein